jgi:hypothetical protein
VSAFHSIGGCSFCPIDIPFRMDDDLFGSPTQVNPSDPSRSNGRVLGHGVRYRIRRRHVGFMARLDCHPTIFITDGIWRRQIEPRPTWRMTARHGISCDKRWPDLSPQLQPDMAQGTAVANYIYKYQYDCQYAEAMADVGTKLSTLFSTVEKIRSVAPLCPTC